MNTVNVPSPRLILAICIAMIIQSYSFAQNNSFLPDTTMLDPATVTGGFSAVTPSLSPRTLVVVGAQEATQTGAASLGDVLEAVPGMDVRSRGPVGVQADLSVRGGTFEQTALWVDGVRWSAPHTGHHLMDLPVAKE